MSQPDFTVEYLDPKTLKPHPQNYRTHPEDQVEHLAQSIEEHGFYRNVVIASDGTILAGHGVVQAAIKKGLATVSAVRLSIAPDSPAALKVLTGDNEIEHLAEQDDRLLSELLKQIGENDPSGLLGTGYDEAMLANLVFVTRPASEIQDTDEAAHWVGMPEYNPDDGESARFKAIIAFRAEEDRASFFERLDLPVPTSKTTSLWWPQKTDGYDDLSSLILEESA